MSIYRQGDVLLVPAAAPTDTTDVCRVDGRLILAEGEATGHHHAVADEHARLVTAAEAAELYLIVHGAPASLVHEEHDTIVVAPGVYEVRRQREYAPERPLQVTD